jgi:hypothetical protein
MPIINANDASTTLKRDIEGKVALKMEEECKRSDPAVCQKKQAEKMTNYKEYAMGHNVFSSQRNTALAIGIPSIVTPNTSLSTTVYTFSRRMSESNDFCPRSLLPYLDDTNDRVPRSWNESPFRKSLSETSLSALQSLQDPILTPSSSSLLLDEMSQQQEFPDINTDTIFSDLGFDVDWGFEEKLPSRKS